MARRGRKRQLDVESRYCQLLLSGVGTVEACRQVGIWEGVFGPDLPAKDVPHEECGDPG
jgi:hypothetical protein